MATQPAGTKVAKITLDQATRKRVAEELGIEAHADRIPDTIHVVRVHASDIGLVKPGQVSWVTIYE